MTYLPSLRRHLLQVVLGCFFGLSPVAPSRANDTEAALGVGGLVFQTSKSVEMLSEDLFVSSEQIVVDYRFRNADKADTTSLVAFPLPEIKFNPDGSSGGGDLNFSTVVDDVPIQMDVERKAMLRGRDETSTLQRHSVPLDPYAAHELLQKADEALVSKLRELSLVDGDGNPTWGLTITYFWKQTFPQGKEVRIEHRYRPIVGGSVMTGLGMSVDDREAYDQYCVDKSFLRAASAASNGRPIYESFSERNIEYILTTGANWVGPIKKFRLVVDKGREDTLVSFCGDGVRKISPTQFEMTASNFTPRRDLAVLILMPKVRIDEASDEDQGSDLAKLSCEQLWYKRNSVFKAAGYCFKSPKAISQFGNAGCRFDDPDLVPLGDADRKWVDAIKAIEQAKRCQH
jgi:hypothetical protein